ncbi:hypothetical protein DFP72DRAFT_1094196 [Ephemerocybe angulata]|uniref:Uncharacterized protein n=1 Tax=Ephemerocybe angulata TaxID=980116 RepID=A0A8H6I9S6_9AGAR|nr:hypothetical protein DFP72DRAFT_1094196 [Tulosesus angulatus]
MSLVQSKQSKVPSTPEARGSSRKGSRRTSSPGSAEGTSFYKHTKKTKQRFLPSTPQSRAGTAREQRAMRKRILSYMYNKKLNEGYATCAISGLFSTNLNGQGLPEIAHMMPRHYTNPKVKALTDRLPQAAGSSTSSDGFPFDLTKWEYVLGYPYQGLNVDSGLNGMVLWVNVHRMLDQGMILILPIQDSVRKVKAMIQEHLGPEEKGKFQGNRESPYQLETNSAYNMREGQKDGWEYTAVKFLMEDPIALLYKDSKPTPNWTVGRNTPDWLGDNFWSTASPAFVFANFCDTIGRKIPNFHQRGSNEPAWYDDKDEDGKAKYEWTPEVQARLEEITELAIQVAKFQVPEGFLLKSPAKTLTAKNTGLQDAGKAPQQDAGNAPQQDAGKASQQDAGKASHGRTLRAKPDKRFQGELKRCEESDEDYASGSDDDDSDYDDSDDSDSSYTP